MVLGFHSRPTVFFLCVVLLFLAPSARGHAQSLHPGAVALGDLDLQLPDPSWTASLERKGRVQLVRHDGERVTAVASIWPVKVPASMRALSRAGHVQAYFEFERSQRRSTDGRWSEFRPGERRINGRAYPVMTFRVTLEDEGDETIRFPGIFVLHFPDDFEVRQTFYALMWAEFADPAGGRGAWDGFDAILSTLRACRSARTAAIVFPEETPALLPSLGIGHGRLIAGVPFIGWHDTPRTNPAIGPVGNPAAVASIGMVLEYWKQDLGLRASTADSVPRAVREWATVELRHASGLDDLRSAIDDGLPVVVINALTPLAHVVNPLVPAVMESKGQRLADRPVSGVLGPMYSFDELRSLRTALDDAGYWETIFDAWRVVVGYDNDRHTIILHDPTFGPAWEVSFEDFDRMWARRGHQYIVLRPRQSGRPPAPDAGALPYPPRTPDQRAAEHFVFGYALASIGRTVDARRELHAGSVIAGLGNGYRHLLLLELAFLDAADGNLEEAIAEAANARDLAPDHYLAWRLLAELHGHRYGGGGAVEGEEEQITALCSDDDAQKRVAGLLAHDFFIVGCVPRQLLSAK